MAIDLQNEQLLSLTDATKAIPLIDGKRPHVSTIWRWCRRGVRGVRLEYVRLGHRVCTSIEALSRFSQQLAEADQLELATPPSIPKRRSDKQQQKRIAAAERTLERAGIQ